MPTEQFNVRLPAETIKTINLHRRKSLGKIESQARVVIRAVECLEEHCPAATPAKKGKK